MPTPSVHLRNGFWVERKSEHASITSYVCGYPRLGNAEINFASLKSVPTAEDVAAWSGHFAVIVVTDNDAMLIVDQIRSYPIFFMQAGEHVAVGDDHRGVLNGRQAIDQNAAELFPHAAFVTGDRTLFAGLRQVRAGEIVTVGATGGVRWDVYRRFRYSRSPLTDPHLVKESFDSALTAGMDRMIARADGRQLAVPLSGGLDSRLISTYLKSVGYDNVVNFTYGRPGGSEIALSKRVAESLGQRWHFVAYPPDEIAAAWASDAAARFIEYSHSASALPHVQDWYALTVLKRDGLLDDDATVLPGHTMVGNIHESAILDDQAPVSAARLKDILIDYHYPLLGQSRAMRDDSRVNSQFDEFLEHLGYDGTVLARAEAMEYFNLAERQAKYINNSMRAYEFFGYQWALPMLDTEMYQMWESLDIAFTRDRTWYRGYVDDWFAQVSTTSLGYFTPTAVPASTRNSVKSALKRFGLETAVQRLLTTRAVSRHHMSLNRFVGPMSRAEVAWRTLRGQNLLGMYSELFLRDVWNPHTHVFH